MLSTKTLLRLLFLSFSFSATSAFADFDSVQQCVNQKYQGLTNRRSIAAAIVDAKNTKLLTYGQAKVDQIFEIGSLTKTFTANLLAQEIVNKNLRLSDAIPSEYQKNGSVITYQHLTTHTSGIIPGNFPGYTGPNPQSPYEGLTIPLFKDFYSRTPLESQPGSKWDYSNIAVGLLGTILGERNQSSYEALVSDRIFKVLGMNDSYFEVPDAAKQRFPQGNVNGQPWSYWDLFNTAIDPAGGIRSTISDMALYTRANLIPESSSLESSITLSHQPLYYVDEHKIWMGMNWILEPDKNLIWHNGSTVGFNSILAISTKYNVAVVALTDTGVFNADSEGHQTEDKSLQDIVFECLQ